MLDPITLGVTVGATLVTVVLTPVFALLVLHRFRRAVAQSMLTSRTGSAPPVDVPPADVPPAQPVAGAWRDRAELVELPRGVSSHSGPLLIRATSQLRRATGWYIAAGAAYAATQTVVLFLLQGHGFLVPRTVVIGFLLAWPIVLTLLVVAAPARWVKVLAVVAYALVALVLGLFAGLSEPETIALWALQEGPATLALLVLARRRLRAVGPFLAPAVFVLGASPLIAWWTVALVQSAGLPAPVGWVLALPAIAAAVAAGLLVVPVAARRHDRKAVSDQSVLLDQWWLIFALFHLVLVLPTAGWPALLMLLPYGAYLLIVRIGRWRLHRRAARHAPTRLLLLRVFGARGRSERLLRDVGAYWRYIGSVQLIAGTDLATETLEPNEFLDFALGRLTRRFISDAAEIAGRVEQLDLRPDADGRFRVNEFFCHDDTWQPVLRALLRSTDVVLVDLRGLTPENRGVAYEVHQLVVLGVLDRVLGLVDDTTDRGFLQWTLATASAHVRPTGSPARLHVMHVRGRRTETRQLLRHLESVPSGRIREGPAAGPTLKW